MRAVDPDPTSIGVDAQSDGEAYLLYVDDSGAEHRFVLVQGHTVTIGRASDADVALEWDKSVSSAHAEAYCVGPYWALSDEGLSRNGTYVNDQRITGRCRLRDGDAIRVGHTHLTFRQPKTDRRDVTTLTDAAGVTGLRTVLFTDLAGSTDLLTRLGEDAGERFMREHFEILHRTVGAHGGQAVKNLGDGLMVAFPSALGAVACAQRMQHDVAVQREAGRSPVGLRIGINAGEVSIGEGDYFGTAVVVAKRLCDRAEPGQTLVSDMVRALVGNRQEHRFVALGSMDLKGIGDPVEVFTLT
jgi:class 3 adenylate cyclase